MGYVEDGNNKCCRMLHMVLKKENRRPGADDFPRTTLWGCAAVQKGEKVSQNQMLFETLYIV
ncbi:MAG: hypothetical protein Q4G47_05380, partial [Lachnospiraceae bacterium]|nr:hypothetical protein [Lachnospiraceae bacterium]